MMNSGATSMNRMVAREEALKLSVTNIINK
jgi:hypothetical protein